MAKPVCLACNDTGVNSKGGICYPCRANGRQPLRDSVLKAVNDVFARHWQHDALPNVDHVLDAVRWAFKPKVEFTAVYRFATGELVRFGGPCLRFEDLQNKRPAKKHPAYIIMTVRVSFFSEPVTIPIARWNGKEWKQKKKNN